MTLSKLFWSTHVNYYKKSQDGFDWARTQDNVSRLFPDSSAVKWTLEGAIAKVIFKRYPTEFDENSKAGKLFLLVEIYLENKINETLCNYNNNHTHSEIIALLDKAIKDTPAILEPFARHKRFLIE